MSSKDTPQSTHLRALEGFLIPKGQIDIAAQNLPPCIVTVEWVSVQYLAGDIGNDWTFNASANGNNFRVVTTTLDPGKTHAVGQTITFKQGACLPLPNVVIPLLCLGTEGDWLVDDYGGNVKVSGPHPCPKTTFAETVDVTVQEIPGGGQCTLRFTFKITLSCNEGV